MYLSIFKEPASIFIKHWFEESACMSILNVVNVETNVESSIWRFTEPGRSLAAGPKFSFSGIENRSVPLLQYNSIISTLITCPHFFSPNLEITFTQA